MPIGYPDIPIGKDGVNQFHTDTYVEVMTEFIKTCDTPMTIAIQGDWGTGKTSMMNLIDGKLGKSVKTIMFNTWQYSQFNLGDQLPILLINRLVNSLSGDQATKETIKNTLKWGARLVGNLALGYLSGGSVSADTEAFDPDQVEVLINMKDTFKKLVEKTAAQYDADRVVIFVDDLDRLQPQKAVEVLEVLKVFLDCEKCVFVLAVDYSVVSKGVRAKYGQEMDDEKGRSFFDKIIQLPFKMPVAQYAINDYLKGLMSSIWGTIELHEQDDIKNYLQIIDCTIGKNPRSIKRTVNSFTIINNVAQREQAYEGDSALLKQHKQKLLFCLLCMQLSCEPLYNYLMCNTDAMLDGAYLSDLKDDASFCEILREIYGRDFTQDDPLFKQLNPVIDIFVDWANDLMNTVSGKDDAREAFQKILTFSSITASSDTAAEKISTERTSFYATLRHGEQEQRITFRSGKRHAASLGAMAYVLIKQYLSENPLTAAQINEKFRAQQLKGFLKDPETVLFPMDEVKKYLAQDQDYYNTERLLSFYFMQGYDTWLPKPPSKVLKKCSIQQTFGPIDVCGEPCFVARYWSIGDLEKLHKALGTEKYISTERSEKTVCIDAFKPEEWKQIRFEFVDTE